MPGESIHVEVKQSGPWIGKLSPMLYGKLVLIPRSAHNALSLTWPPRRQEGSSSFPLHSMHNLGVTTEDPTVIRSLEPSNIRPTYRIPFATFSHFT